MFENCRGTGCEQGFHRESKGRISGATIVLEDDAVIEDVDFTGCKLRIEGNRTKLRRVRGNFNDVIIIGDDADIQGEDV